MQPTIELAKSSNTLNKLTFVLLYATDFADRLEKEIIPALKAGFVVLSDRYIFTALARAGVRGVDRQWLRNLYGFAIAPHMVFYLNIDVKTLIGRVLESRGMDFWESGMDLKHGDDIYDSFRAYQSKLLREYASMADEFHFRVARRAPIRSTRSRTSCGKQVAAFLEPAERPAERPPDSATALRPWRRGRSSRLAIRLANRRRPSSPQRRRRDARNADVRAQRASLRPASGVKRDLDFAGLREVGLVLPLRRDLPGDDDAWAAPSRARWPHVAVGAVDLLV